MYRTANMLLRLLFNFMTGLTSDRCYLFMIDNARKRCTVMPESRVYFTPQYPADMHTSDQPSPLRLRKIVDLVSGC